MLAAGGGGASVGYQLNDTPPFHSASKNSLNSLRFSLNVEESICSNNGQRGRKEREIHVVLE